MSLRVLELDTLHLTNPDHHLKLSVVSAADIRILRSISSLEDAALVKALTSGSLWVSRGMACHLDVQVFLNGKPLDRSGRINLLESLGYRIRDARLWSQLSLSASLDIWQNDDTVDTVPDLSININHGLETSNPRSRQRAWVLDTFDIKPPDSVLCAEFERMQIQFNFNEIRKKAKRIKRDKPDAVEFDVEEEMLLDFAPDSGEHRHMDDLAHSVDRMRGLSGMIERCFESKSDFYEEPDLLQEFHLTSLTQHQDQPPHAQVQDILGQSGKDNESKNGTRRHPKATVEILNAWLRAHTDNPYPSNAQALELVTRTGLSRTQVRSWFEYQRRKIRKNSAIPEDEVLLAQGEDDASIQQVEDQEEDDMLLSQATENTPSLTSQSSVASSAVSTQPRESSLKRPSLGDEPFLLDKSPACELAEAAIHILMSGYIGRGLRELGGIQVEKPPPNKSLASIAPSTFCPGFKESMAHNAQFLPTVSHAISVSWPRNIQSPTLREKLSRLGNSPTSSLTNESRTENGEEGTTARLAAVVQSTLWGMMQRKLYDPSDAAKVWRKSTLQENPAEEDECPVLLGILGGPDGVGDRFATKLDEFDYDEVDEFEDLLSRDDDDLLEYMEERERLSVERETEEMLFGSGWDEDDACLLDGEAEGDAMLL